MTATGGVIALVAKTLRAKKYFHGTHIKEGKIIVTKNRLTKTKTKTAPSTDGVAFIDGDEDIACERRPCLPQLARWASSQWVHSR